MEHRFGMETWTTIILLCLREIWLVEEHFRAMEGQLYLFWRSISHFRWLCSFFVPCRAVADLCSILFPHGVWWKSVEHYGYVLNSSSSPHIR